jgi:hypothetical protein
MDLLLTPQEMVCKNDPQYPEKRPMTTLGLLQRKSAAIHAGERG